MGVVCINYPFSKDNTAIDVRCARSRYNTTGKEENDDQVALLLSHRKIYRV